MESLRHRLKHFFRFVMIPIFSGPLRGHWWSLSSGLPFVLGKFEKPKVDAWLALLKPNQTVLDIGAHVGYFSGIAATRVGVKGNVISFEPRPLNSDFLNLHCKKNNWTQIKVLPFCVGAKSQSAYFDNKTGTGTGRVATDGKLKVTMVSLDDLWVQGAFAKVDLLKIDVEGGELEVLRGAEQLIKKYRPQMILATHGKQIHEECLKFLESRDYTVKPIEEVQTLGDLELLVLPNG